METQNLYLNSAQQRAHLIHPKNYIGLLGRAAGKSRRILAMRTSRLAYEMPGAMFGLYADSYINAASNLVPNIIDGWNELGYYENIHYVIDKAPPKHFSPLILHPRDFKHTIIWHTGTVFIVISDDRPIGGNGRSLQHLFGDEIRLVSYEKMKQSVFPAIRGERIRFGKVPQFQGVTFTSDMPDYNNAEWILAREDEMDREKILRIMQISIQYDDIRLKYLNAKAKNQQRLVRSLHKEMIMYEMALNVLRKDSTYFDIASTFVNVEALGIDAIRNMLASLDWEEFKRAILSIKPTAVDNMFYAGFGLRNIYTAYNYDYYDSFSLKDIKRCSMGDKYISHTLPLDAGMDFGNMDSLVIGQEIGNELYREFHALKFFYCLTPDTYKDVAKEFVEYYKFHKKKVLNYYYDRAANSNRNEREPLAQAFASEIRALDRDWTVNLKSVGWGNVPHDQKNMLWKMILSESDPKFPRFRINEGNCKELVLSMQMAPTKVEEGKIKKDKRSEKKKLADLPTKSTNPSDAIDYLIWGKYSHLLKNTIAYRVKTK
jgi:hypothetical protein